MNLMVKSSVQPSRSTSAIGKDGRFAPAFRRLSLTFRVHFDAFQFSPIDYLKAVWWRARGLRLRFKNKLAELKGRSELAYPLWIEKIEPQVRSRFPVSRGVSITVVIDCTRSHEGLERTLASLGHARDLAVVVGANHLDGPFKRVRNVGELAASMAGDRWLCIVYPGDVLAPDALAFYSYAARNSPNCSIIYADDDVICSDHRRKNPHFKPEWNPELFENHDFVTGSAVVRVTSADFQTGSMDWAHDLVSRVAARCQAPVHLPIVLHHRRHRPEPIPPTDKKHLPPTGSVAVIIPTRNHLQLLRRCLEGVESADYPSVKVVIVDNGSDEPDTLAYLNKLETEGLVTVLRHPGPFNYSALNNAAVQILETDYLCFLNNDVEMLEDDWLQWLIAQASREDIGAVGAQLLYPDGTVQHAGVFTGIGGGAGHAHRFLPRDNPGYFQRARLPQRVSAVTGACLVVSREKFLAVDGFDETDFPVAFNDVDLCLKLNARGWQSFYEPRATLIHHESKSRGSDRARANRSRFAGELAALKRKWRTDQACDPYHNPNLSQFCEQFLIAV